MGQENKPQTTADLWKHPSFFLTIPTPSSKFVCCITLNLRKQGSHVLFNLFKHGGNVHILYEAVLNLSSIPLKQFDLQNLPRLFRGIRFPFMVVSIMGFRSFLKACLHILGRSESALTRTRKRPQAHCDKAAHSTNLPREIPPYRCPRSQAR